MKENKISGTRKRVITQVISRVLITTALFSVIMSCKQNNPLRINFTGDVILARGVEDELSIHGDTILSNAIEPFFDGDYNIINLETVLTSKMDSQRDGYTFRNDLKIAEYLEIGGVSHASLANNHSGDFGKEGYLDTWHKFAKEVFFGNNQEFKVGSKEDQNIALTSRNLIQNSVVLWNYLTLTKQLSSEDSVSVGNIIKSLNNTSMISWRHINIHGEYDLNSLGLQSANFDVKSLVKYQIKDLSD